MRGRGHALEGHRNQGGHPRQKRLRGCSVDWSSGLALQLRPQVSKVNFRRSLKAHLGCLPQINIPNPKLNALFILFEKHVTERIKYVLDQKVPNVKQCDQILEQKVAQISTQVVQKCSQPFFIEK